MRNTTTLSQTSVLNIYSLSVVFRDWKSNVPSIISTETPARTDQARKYALKARFPQRTPHIPNNQSKHSIQVFDISWAACYSLTQHPRLSFRAHLSPVIILSITCLLFLQRGVYANSSRSSRRHLSLRHAHAWGSQLTHEHAHARAGA